MDSASLSARSLGIAILGVTIRVQGDPCMVRVLSIPTCSEVVTFADYGLAPGTVFGFSLSFFGDPGGGYNPYMELFAVEVPEPSLVALAGVGLLVMARRVRRR